MTVLRDALFQIIQLVVRTQKYFLLLELHLALCSFLLLVCWWWVMMPKMRR